MPPTVERTAVRRVQITTKSRRNVGQKVCARDNEQTRHLLNSSAWRKTASVSVDRWAPRHITAENGPTEKKGQSRRPSRSPRRPDRTTRIGDDHKNSVHSDYDAEMISIGGSDGQITNQRRTEDSNNLAVKYTNTVFTYGSTDGTSNLQSTKLLIKCYLFFTCYSIKRTDCKDTQDSLFIIRNSAVQRYPKKLPLPRQILL